MTHPIEKQTKLMGSPFCVRVYPSAEQSPAFIAQVIDLAFGEILRIENLLTDFKPSPFNTINQYAGQKPIKVTREIFDLIDLSLQISKDSEGAFDISYASVGNLWREAAKNKTPPLQKHIDQAKAYVDYRQIQMDYNERTVFLPHSQMRISLGGLGKGYAVDKAYDLMKAMGLVNFFINGAGDTRVHTTDEAPRPWKLAIRNPLGQNDQAMGLVSLKQGAMATSGDYERFFTYQDKNYHHVFKASEGEMTEDVASVTVIAPMALWADILATTAMSLGCDKGLKFLNSRRQVRGLMISKQGDVRVTDSFRSSNQEVHARI